jgi:Amt family ammonium transporter
VLFDKVKIDDPVGAISVHGVAGFFGLMIVPLSNADATILAQLYGACVIFFWVFLASLVVWAALKVTMGIRVSEEDEFDGVDMSDCGVVAYPEFIKVKT